MLPAPAETFPYELDFSLLFLVTGIVNISSLLGQPSALKVPPLQSSTPRTDTGPSESLPNFTTTHCFISPSLFEKVPTLLTAPSAESFLWVARFHLWGKKPLAEEQSRY